MNSDIWGPKLWFIIHTIALNFSDNPTYNEIRNIEMFFNSLKFNIPCEKCRIHYSERLDKNPIINHLKNSETIFKYTIDLHNEVNKSLGKRIYSYDEVLEIYKNEYNDNTNNPNTKCFINKNNVMISITLILVIFIICYYCKIFKFRTIHFK
jgi:hypothetical protein